MRPIPLDMREEMAQDKFYHDCCLKDDHCSGKIEWHHTVNGRELPRPWGIDLQQPVRDGGVADVVEMHVGGRDEVAALAALALAVLIADLRRSLRAVRACDARKLPNDPLGELGA